MQTDPTESTAANDTQKKKDENRLIKAKEGLGTYKVDARTQLDRTYGEIKTAPLAVLTKASENTGRVMELATTQARLSAAKATDGATELIAAGLSNAASGTRRVLGKAASLTGQAALATGKATGQALGTAAGLTGQAALATGKAALATGKATGQAIGSAAALTGQAALATGKATGQAIESAAALTGEAALATGQAIGTAAALTGKAAMNAANKTKRLARNGRNKTVKGIYDGKSTFLKGLRKVYRITTTNKPSFMGPPPISNKFTKITEMCNSFAQECNTLPKKGETKPYLQNLLDNGQDIIWSVKGKTKEEWEGMIGIPTEFKNKMDRVETPDLEYLFKVELLSNHLNGDLLGTSQEAKQLTPEIYKDVYYVAHKKAIEEEDLTHDDSIIPVDIKEIVNREIEKNKTQGGTASNGMQKISDLIIIAGDAASAAEDASQGLETYLTNLSITSESTQPSDEVKAQIQAYIDKAKDSVNAAKKAFDEAKKGTSENENYKQIVKLIGFLYESSQASLQALETLNTNYTANSKTDALSTLKKESEKIEELKKKIEETEETEKPEEQGTDVVYNPSTLIQAYGPTMYKRLKPGLMNIEITFNREYHTQFINGPYKAVMAYKKNNKEQDKVLEGLLSISSTPAATEATESGSSDPGINDLKEESKEIMKQLNATKKQEARWRNKKTGKHFIVKREKLGTQKYKYSIEPDPFHEDEPNAPPSASPASASSASSSAPAPPASSASAPASASAPPASPAPAPPANKGPEPANKGPKPPTNGPASAPPANPASAPPPTNGPASAPPANAPPTNAPPANGPASAPPANPAPPPPTNGPASAPPASAPPANGPPTKGPEPAK